MKIILIALTLLVAGCANWGDAVIPKNPYSDAHENEVNCLKTAYATDEAAAALLLAPAVKYLGGLAIDEIGKAIELESKRYKATYSSRLPDMLLNFKKNGADEITTQRIVGFTFARFVGDAKLKQCPDDFEAHGPAMLFAGNISIVNGNVMKIVPTKFLYNMAKAKVPFWDKVIDVDVQFSMSMLTDGKDGAALVEIARVDFPQGKVPLGVSFKRNEAELARLAAGWYGVPPTKKPAVSGTYGPVVMTVTVIEADDLGDVIAKGASAVTEQKAKLLGGLLKGLGLDEGK